MLTAPLKKAFHSHSILGQSLYMNRGHTVHTAFLFGDLDVQFNLEDFLAV